MFERVPFKFPKSSSSHITCTFILVLLRHKGTNQNILFSTTHLKAKSSIETEEIRLRQVEYILSRIEAVISLTSVPHCLFVGDLNTDCYPLEKSDAPIIFPRTIDLLLQWNNSYFNSVYPLPLNGKNNFF